jgi:hypothetical protein
MDIRFNKIFGNLSNGNLDIETSLCNVVNFIIDENFIIIDGCYYFKSLAPKALYYSKELFDRTGNECFFNKISLEYSRDSSNPLNEFHCGISSSFKLFKKLNKSFEGVSFSVIFSYNTEGSNIRFHKIRANENWLAANIDDYKDDAILEIAS